MSDNLDQSHERLDPSIKPPDASGDPYRDLHTGDRLYPLFCAGCGAIALYSTVPLRSGARVPAVEHLLLSDGITPMWGVARGLLTGRARPPAPECPGCGESLNRNLRTQPGRN